MIEAVEDVLLLDRCAQSVEKTVLRCVMDNPISAGDEKLRRHDNRVGIRDDPLGGFVEREQDVHRYRPRDQRIGVVACDPRRVVGQELRLDVAVDEEMAADLSHQRKSGAREGDVELHLEGG